MLTEPFDYCAVMHPVSVGLSVGLSAAVPPLIMPDTSNEELAPFQKAGVSFLRHVEGCGGRALVHCIAG